MFWVIRWADSGEDHAVVIEAETRAAAEYAALKRNIPVVIVGEADHADVRAARREKRLWKYTPDPTYTCFGRPASGFHVMCFMMAGVLTAMLHVTRVLHSTSLLPTVQQWVG